MVDYNPPTKSFAHQDRAREKMHGKPGFALWCDMGTGKSRVIIDEWGTLVVNGQSFDLLLFAPKGCYLNWESELLLHLDPAVSDFIRIATWDGSAKTRKQLEWFMKLRGVPRAFLVNIEALSNKESPVIDLCKQFLSVYVGSMCVVDEITTISEEKAQRSQSIFQIARLADWRRGLSGLPTPRTPLSLYSQFKFLDPTALGFDNFVSFKARYAIEQNIKTGRIEAYRDENGDEKYRPHTVNKIVDYRYLDQLKTLIDPYVFRVLKEECLDLPPKTFQLRKMEMTKEQKRIYDGIVKEATAEIIQDVHITVDRKITQIMRLQEVLCGFVTDEARNKHDLPNNKIPTLLDMIEDNEGKWVIWIPFDHSIRAVGARIEERFGKDFVAYFWGGNDKTRKHDEERFKKDEKCGCILSTQASGGMGNNWTVANKTFYFANTFRLDHRLQSEDRTHRSGQTSQNVAYVDAIVPGTVEEKIVNALRDRIDLASLITGDGYRQWLINR